MSSKCSLTNKKQAAFITKAACFLFFISLSLFNPENSPAMDTQLEFKRIDLITQARKSKAWENPEWHKLLFYEKNLFGGTSSNVNNERFFLSKSGAISPQLELEAAIDGLFFDGKPDESPECRFPERYRWLRKQLNINEDKAAKPVCREFEEWKNTLDVGNASLVFAGSYLNNPASSYGHTFLRLHRRHTEGADMLDYTLNYAAKAENDKGLLYAVKGIFGAYPGQFATTPYYIKIQEYRNAGSRDLWEFPLNLSEEEMETLLRRAWEMGSFTYPYYFFPKNCSWALLPLLEVVRPGIQLENRFNVAVIPSDSAKVIAETFKSRPLYRPSLLKTVQWKRSQLSSDEQDAAYDLSNGKKQKEALAALDRFSDERKAAILEYSGDYISWLVHSGKIRKEEGDKRTMPLMSARAALGQHETFTGQPETPPSILDAHESFRLMAGTVFYSGGSAIEFAARGALQDLLDNPDGYAEDSELELLNLRGRYAFDTGRVYLEEAILGKAVSFNPVSRWERQKSWGMGIKLEQARETGRKIGNALIGTPYAEAGISYRVDNSNWLSQYRPMLYALGGLEAGIGPSLGDDDWRLGGGLRFGVLAEAMPYYAKSSDGKDKPVYGRSGRIRINAEARSYGYFAGYSAALWTGKIAASYSLSRNSAIRTQYSWRKSYNEFGIYFSHFIPAP